MSYNHWHACLAAREAGQPIPNLPSAEVQEGCWRYRGRDGKWIGVQVFGRSGVLWRSEAGHVDLINLDWTERVFSYAARNPVMHEELLAANNGKGWPDDKPASQQIGSNEPTDPVEILNDQIASLEGEKIDIASDDDLAKSQGFRARANELAREADKKRTDEKEPHLVAGKAVDERWMPVVKRAKTVADGILAKMSAYETAKLRAARKAAEEAAEAARAARVANALPPDPPLPEPVYAPRAVKGGHGKAASSKIEKYAVVEDWVALAGWLSVDEDVRALLQKKADRIAANRSHVPGCRVEERASFR